MDPGQRDVVVDVERVDGSQVGVSVCERQQVRVVDGHLKLGAGAEDLQLERLPLDEGEPRQLPLFLSPPFIDAAVPDDHLIAALVEARVEVENQVTRGGQIHCELVSVGFDGSSDGDEQFVVNSSLKTLVIRNRQTLGSSRSR